MRWLSLSQLARRENSASLVGRRDFAAHIRGRLVSVMQQVLVGIPYLLLKEVVEVVHRGSVVARKIYSIFSVIWFVML